MRVRARIPIPLVGHQPITSKVKHRSPVWHALGGTLTGSDVRRLYTDMDRKTRQFTVVKPERMLGAPWMDNFVCNRKIVALCELCYRRYDKWWVKHNYRPDWDRKVISDCDGCSRKFIYVTDFFPNGAT